MRRWCPNTLQDVFASDMPIVGLPEEVGCVRRLLRLVGNVDVTSEYRGHDLCCRADTIGGFYLVKYADTWRRELKVEGRHGIMCIVREIVQKYGRFHLTTGTTSIPWYSGTKQLGTQIESLY